MARDDFDRTIGRLDRVLSEFLALYNPDLDEPDRQTLKHHADDLIGVGKKMHELLERASDTTTKANTGEQSTRGY